MSTEDILLRIEELTRIQNTLDGERKDTFRRLRMGAINPHNDQWNMDIKESFIENLEEGSRIAGEISDLTRGKT